MHSAVAHPQLTDAHPAPEQQLLSRPTLPVLLLSLMPHGMGYPFGQCQSLSWLCPLPASCAPSACSLAGHHEKLNSPWLHVSTVLQQLKHWCVISIILILNPKHGTISATRKKTIQPKLGQQSYLMAEDGKYLNYFREKSYSESECCFMNQGQLV